MNEQQYIQRIQQLEFQYQELLANYTKLYQTSKHLIDAAQDYEKYKSMSSQKIKAQKFSILHNYRQQLKQIIYPQTKPCNQAKFNWLAQ